MLSRARLKKYGAARRALMGKALELVAMIDACLPEDPDPMHIVHRHGYNGGDGAMKPIMGVIEWLHLHFDQVAIAMGAEVGPFGTEGHEPLPVGRIRCLECGEPADMETLSCPCGWSRERDVRLHDACETAGLDYGDLLTETDATAAEIELALEHGASGHLDSFRHVLGDIRDGLIRAVQAVS